MTMTNDQSAPKQKDVVVIPQPQAAASKPKDKEVAKKRKSGEQGKDMKAGVASSGSGVSVITLAGENKGSSMKIHAKSSKNKERHGHRLDGGEGMTTTTTALINSNVQVINNSLLLHSSCSGANPGVHLTLKQQHKGSNPTPAPAPQAP